MIEIPLTRGLVAVVDDADEDLVSGQKWCAYRDHCSFYAATTIGTRQTGRTLRKMHRLILGLNDPDILVDHRDGNGLNNSRTNLRVATRSLNQQNRRAQSGHTSAYKGVYWRKDTEKWQAHIRANGKRTILGSFVDEEAAALAYDNAARTLQQWPTFNFPLENERSALIP